MLNFSIDNLKYKTVHFVGIGGISMSALAQMLMREGVKIQGSDEGENDEIKKLKALGVLIFSKHKKDNVLGADAVVYSSAIGEDNCELLMAKERGITILKRAELLALVASKYDFVISIAGSHGKTTATALISEIFLNAGLNPTIHLGGVLNKINSNYNIGQKEFFITESCEYKDNFLYLKPDISVILNIDADHLDYFKNLNNVKKSFLRFSNNTKKTGINIICCEDNNSSKLFKSAKSVYFGLKNGDIYAKNIKIIKNSHITYDVIFNKIRVGKINSNIVGRFNIYNQLAAILVSLLCGIDFEIIKQTIEHFEGVLRRFQFVKELKGVKIFHDYAHHPRQIREVVSVAKGMIKNKGKLYVFYEPHTYSRTKYLLDDFVKSFVNCDYLYLLPVYSAREKESAGVDSKFLCKEVLKTDINVKNIGSYIDAKNIIISNTKENDLVLILGAGSIEKMLKIL